MGAVTEPQWLQNLTFHIIHVSLYTGCYARLLDRNPNYETKGEKYLLVVHLVVRTGIDQEADRLSLFTVFKAVLIHGHQEQWRVAELLQAWWLFFNCFLCQEFR